jgi:hypothetical protein
VARLRIASIGVGGRGWANTISAAQSADVVAICDVEERQLGRYATALPGARRYVDYRELLLKERELDGVIVSTPDHSHAAIASAAMDRRLHCYCEKPLSHSVGEAIAVARTARRAGVTTQLGTQGVADPRSREAIEVIRSGALGRIREIHAWTDRPGEWWPADYSNRTADAAPSSLHWSLWLCGAADPGYGPDLVPFKWRGHQRFGTGAIGDMGAHLLAVPFIALGLPAADSVGGEWAPFQSPAYPSWSRLRFRFGRHSGWDDLDLFWYDGGQRPPQALVDDYRMDENGCVVVGERGRYYFGGWSAHFKYLLPQSAFAGFEAPPPSLPRVASHLDEWLEASSEHRPTSLAGFEQLLPLTETILLGTLALTRQQPLERGSRDHDRS